MFLSLNRKLMYTLFSLFIISILLFSFTFYIAYSSKIEKDQLLSIQRNQEYIDLLYRSTNLTKELKNLVKQNPNLDIDSKNYHHIYTLINDINQQERLFAEQNLVIERSKSFDDQYQTISLGIRIIFASTIFLALFIIFIGYLINQWILLPINNISTISEQISNGNFNLRIPLTKTSHFTDELDNLSLTFNQMLDNLQNTLSKTQEQENFLQALIDSIPDGIRVIDENYQIILANKAYYKQTGDRPHSCRKCYTSSFKTKYPCEHQHLQCPLNEILHKGKSHLTIIQQFANNPTKHLAVNAALLNYNKNKKYVIESIRDLSEDISFSHQQKISSLGFLTSSIAHEIKNNLGALRIIMEHLIDKYYQNKPDDCEEKKMMNMIHSELVNAVDVPERLLKLTRNSDTSSTQIDCIASISDILSLMDFEAKSKGIDIIFQQPKKPIFINGNETDFKIAIINIIQNAIKAMPDKGTLKITIKTSSDNISVNFSDTGIGISKDSLPSIFNPFFSEGRQKKAGSSSGLGLAITKSIIEKLGGTISVTSTVGKGSCFSFSFPQNKKLAKK